MRVLTSVCSSVDKLDRRSLISSTLHTTYHVDQTVGDFSVFIFWTRLSLSQVTEEEEEEEEDSA